MITNRRNLLKGFALATALPAIAPTGPEPPPKTSPTPPPSNGTKFLFFKEPRDWPQGSNIFHLSDLPKFIAERTPLPVKESDIDARMSIVSSDCVKYTVTLLHGVELGEISEVIIIPEMVDDSLTPKIGAIVSLNRPAYKHALNRVTFDLVLALDNIPSMLTNA